MARVSKGRSKKPLTFTHGIILGTISAIIMSAGAFELFQSPHEPIAYTQGEGTGESNKVCFTPGRSCQKLILDQLTQAKKSIMVQAYSFTDRQITQLLVDKKKQGVQVQVILDKSNRKDPQGQLRILKKNQIPVRIDTPAGIAHNKIIIIDHETLITGSYNFSVSAYKRNVENVLVLKNKNLIDQYIQNWYQRWQLSKEH